MKQLIRGFLLMAVSAQALSAQTVAIPLIEIKNPITHEEIQKYISQVDYLATNLKSLDSLAPDALLQLQGRICGAYFNDKLTQSEWIKMRSSETKLIGGILMSLESRVDQSIDTTKSFPISYPPYELTAKTEDINNKEKKKAYYDSVAAKIKEDNKIKAQIQLKQKIIIYIRKNTFYFHRLYTEAEQNQAKTVLDDMGLNKTDIDLLINK